jgi:putative alpha-1,2-mannosidase
MGFYPVCPCSDYYVIGSPSLPKVEMRLSNGRKFTMTAANLSDKNIYIQSVALNGRDWNSPFLPARAVLKGGTLSFQMGPEPNKTWGTDAKVPE